MSLGYDSILASTKKSTREALSLAACLAKCIAYQVSSWSCLHTPWVVRSSCSLEESFFARIDGQIAGKCDDGESETLRVTVHVQRDMVVVSSTAARQAVHVLGWAARGGLYSRATRPMAWLGHRR